MNGKEYIDFLNEDYANALVHLVCVSTIADNTYSLVFGFIELYPTECAGLPIETDWQSMGLKKHRLFC
jgi:hypothetical protein